jgi:hypothetical protein
MEMNLDLGTYETVINLRGPSKLDVMKNGSAITTVEIPLKEVYKLVIKRNGTKGAVKNTLKGAA